MRVGFILAAGKQSRFDSHIPKALSMYNGSSILDMNIDIMKLYCDDIFVVCSDTNKKYFNKYQTIITKKNLGCGDTVTKVLDYYINAYKPSKNTECIIQWGDSIQTYNVYESLDFGDKSDFIIQVPCYEEKSPYVSLKLNEFLNNHIEKVLFSKFGEVDSSERGWHDCSLFYGNIYYIYNACIRFLNYFREKDGYKDIGHGNEFNFLDIFNETMARGFGRPINKNKGFPKSFNTVDELYYIGGYI
jgi:hypothetical protein